MVIKLCKTDGCLMAETREEVDSIVANLSEDQKNKIKYFNDVLATEAAFNALFTI